MIKLFCLIKEYSCHWLLKLKKKISIALEKYQYLYHLTISIWKIGYGKGPTRPKIPWNGRHVHSAILVVPLCWAQITQPEEGINISPSQNAHKKF